LYCDLLMYADDLQLYFSDKQKLMKIADTCKKDIRAVDQAINLGISLNSNLIRNDHINRDVCKSFGVLRQLYMTQHILPIHIKLLIAKSYLIPILFYRVELFGAAVTGSQQKRPAHNLLFKENF